MKISMKTIAANFEEIIASATLIITTALVLMNVFLRYFLHTGIYWSEEVATSSFVWSVFIGASACYKRNMHIGVDVLAKKLSPSGKKVLKVIIDVLLLVIIGYITYIAILYLKNSYKKPTPVLGISTAYISSSILLSFLLMTFHSIRFLIADIKNLPAKKGAATAGIFKEA